jgi:hypothetical protein
VRTLERHRIDEIVRELETGGYGLALAPGLEPASAERILLEAFAGMAPSVPRTTRIDSLRKELYRRLRKRAPQGWGSATSGPAVATEASVSESLHLRLVDIVEEHQADEPEGRRRAMLIGFIGVAMLAGGIAFVRVHADALAAAQPTIDDLSPPAAASGVPVSGDVRVKFGRRPSETPTLRLEPAHAALELVHWDGNTLVAVYTGLHLTTRYQLVLQADYRSGLNDVGHFEKRWIVTTQGYPVLSALLPAPDQKLAARVGKLAVDFSYRPPVDPRLTIVPADGTLTPGGWYGNSWSAGYYGLKPLTRYEVTLTVDYGAAAASTRRQWVFSTEPGWPAAGVPVIWYGTKPPWTPSDQRLLAVDWHGELAGSLYPASVTLQASPDGSLLLTQDGGYIDGNGAGPGTTPYYPSVLTADDNRSVCELVGTGQLSLVTGPVRGPMRRVASAGLMAGRSNLEIIACSVTSDRAVIADNGNAGTTAIRVIALSTGRLLYQRSYTGSFVSVICSRDGRYLGEQTSTVDNQGQVSSAFTVIRRTLDGRIMGRLDNRRVLRFSWDGMRVVTVAYATGNDVTLLEWQTGKVLWRPPAANTGLPAFTMAQPNGTAMAVALGSLDRGGLSDHLWIVSADGQAIQVAGAEFYPGFPGSF